MRRELVVMALTSLVIAQSATAGERQPRRTDGDELREAAAMIAKVAEAMQHAGEKRGEAAVLLKDAVRTGTADAEAFATITDWILYEKEETVAAGLADAIGTALPTRAGHDARWNQTAQAMIGLFTGLLRDAQTNRRVDDSEADKRMSAVIAAAAPAVTAALRDAGLNACVVDAAADALTKIQDK